MERRGEGGKRRGREGKGREREGERGKGELRGGGGGGGGIRGGRGKISFKGKVSMRNCNGSTDKG